MAAPFYPSSASNAPPATFGQASAPPYPPHTSPAMLMAPGDHNPYYLYAGEPALGDMSSYQRPLYVHPSTQSPYQYGPPAYSQQPYTTTIAATTSLYPSIPVDAASETIVDMDTGPASSEDEEAAVDGTPRQEVYTNGDYGLDASDDGDETHIARANACIRVRDRASGANRIAELKPPAHGAAAQAPPSVVAAPAAPGRFAKYIPSIPSIIAQPKVTVTQKMTDFKMRGVAGAQLSKRETMTALIQRQIPLREWHRYNESDPLVTTEAWRILDIIADEKLVPGILLDSLRLCGWSYKTLTHHPEAHIHEAQIWNGERIGSQIRLDGRVFWDCLLRWGFSGEIIRRPFAERSIWFNTPIVTGIGIGLKQLKQDAGLTVDDLLTGEVTSNELRQWASANFAGSPFPFLVVSMHMTSAQFSRFKYTPAEWTQRLEVTANMLLDFKMLEVEDVRDYLRAERGWSCKTLIDTFAMDPKAAEKAWYARSAKKRKAKKVKKHSVSKVREIQHHQPVRSGPRSVASLDQWNSL